MTSVHYSMVLGLAALVALISFAGPSPAKAVTTGASAEGVSVESASSERSTQKETPAQRDARMGWWREAKFGLFIHWGVYAVPAGKYGEQDDYGEWIMHSAKIPVAEYRGFARQFNPRKYNPAAWARIAKDAGWRKVAEGQTSGHGVSQTIPTVTARKFRFTMECDKGSPGIAELQLYAPE